MKALSGNESNLELKRHDIEDLEQTSEREGVLDGHTRSVCSCAAHEDVALASYNSDCRV